MANHEQIALARAPIVTLLYCFVLFNLCNSSPALPAITQARLGNCWNKNHSRTQRIQLTTKSWQEKLQADSYDIDMAPEFPAQTTVYVQTNPFGLTYVDETLQTIRLTMGLQLRWQDDRLAFHHERHHNVCSFPFRHTLTVLPTDTSQQQLIWIPVLFLHNRQETAATPLLRVLKLLVSPSGEVRLQAFFHEIRSCNIKAKYYPFDEQRCPLTLEVFENVKLVHDSFYEHNETLERLEKLRHNPALVALEWETNEWRLYANEQQLKLTLSNVTSKVYPDQGSYITYPIFLTRKSSQHVVSWIASPIVLCMSSVVGIYGGCNVGERFGFGGTVVVTMTLTFNELRTLLSISEDGYPILCQMYIGLEMTLIFATLTSGLPRRWSTKKNRVGPKKLLCHVGTVHRELERTRGNWSENMFDAVFMGFVLILQALVVGVTLFRWIL